MKSGWFFILPALVIIICMVAHPVISHEHEEEAAGIGLPTALHSEDRKWFALLLALGLVLVAVAQGLAEAKLLWVHRIEERSEIGFANPLRLALSRGIVHPKLCG